MSEHNEKLIPLKREQAALLWALGDRPVHAMVNGLVRQIKPIAPTPFWYVGESWSCRVLEDEEAKFYLGLEAGT